VTAVGVVREVLGGSFQGFTIELAERTSALDYANVYFLLFMCFKESH
jgi:hypothetical protein